jgi:hypothetical protein
MEQRVELFGSTLGSHRRSVMRPYFVPRFSFFVLRSSFFVFRIACKQKAPRLIVGRDRTKVTASAAI